MFKKILIGFGSLGVIGGTGVSVYYGVDKYNKREEDKKKTVEEKTQTVEQKEEGEKEKKDEEEETKEKGSKSEVDDKTKKIT